VRDVRNLLERYMHPMGWLGLGRMVIQVVMFGGVVYFALNDNIQMAFNCLFLIYLLGLQNELEQAHQCIHKMGALIGMMQMPGVAEKIQAEVERVHEAIRNGQNPEDVLK